MKEWAQMAQSAFLQWKELLLFVLAIYGAVLSTVNYWKASRKDRRFISVSVYTSIPFDGANLGQTYVTIRAVNMGHRPVSVRSIEFLLRSGNTLIPMVIYPLLKNTPLPAALGDGDTAVVHFSYADLAGVLNAQGYEGVTKLIPICRDTAGGTHRGNAFKVNIREFARI